ncbi:hypothetical protein HH303_19190 [Rhodospirillaceae bacterium KN72]|uniref:Uncharacterized protein n=1 Tax=Pacificispira spongiicola TaxID=2729598 RepID=A0A7Y0E3N2_9PROT|nr:hypothetical protein [Pacificispira spongiicola]NMM46624.1 hypothetical protein [Pacificispira spongiicola]
MDLNFNAEMFSDPTMRPHLKALYDEKYSAIYDRIDAMEEKGAAGQQTISVRGPNGETVEAKEISAAQYRAAIPSFDDWLDFQSTFTQRMTEMTENSVESARKMVEHLKQDGPDTSSGVRTVFSSGDRILGYINEDGSVVSHSGGSALQDLARQANTLNLTGEDKIAYIRDHATAALSGRFGALKVTDYTEDTMPMKREFAAAWYPGHSAVNDHASNLAAARDHLARMEDLYQNHQKNLSEMKAFLLQHIQEANA